MLKVYYILLLSVAALFVSCGQSYEEKTELSRAERRRLAREDSAALKIAVMPTLDCMPAYVALSRGYFADEQIDVRLRRFTAQMDCDTALAGKSVEGAFTDLVRAERLVRSGLPLEYPVATNAYWVLVANKNSTVKTLKDLRMKMIAMTRCSATELLADKAADKAGLNADWVFKVQINDVAIRLSMLRNNEIDALLLTEPQLTVALKEKHGQLLDSRKLDCRLGALAFRADLYKDPAREKQIGKFLKAYNRACDSLNVRGLSEYGDLLTEYYGIGGDVVSLIPKDIRFPKAAKPRSKDLETARAWLDR